MRCVTASHLKITITHSLLPNHQSTIIKYFTNSNWQQQYINRC